MAASDKHERRVKVSLRVTLTTFSMMLVVVNSARGAAGDTIMPAKYRLTKDGATIGPVWRLFKNSFYHPTIGTYCADDHRDPDGNRYEHSHLPHGFPFSDGGTTVTVQMSDWAWDAYYGSSSRLSNSTFAKNCFAYAEDAPTVMFEPGWLAFTNPSSLKYATSYGTASHVIRIEAVVFKDWGTIYYCEWVISETTEKNGSSGVYQEFYLPVGHQPEWWESVRKHK